jgi:hypothetical protein
VRPASNAQVSRRYTRNNASESPLFRQPRRDNIQVKLEICLGRSFSKAKHCLWFLRIGQAFGVAAVIVVLTGSLIVFLTPNKDAPSEPTTVIAVTDQGVRCGKVGGSAEALTVADQPLAAMPAVTVVDACPGT